jgi:nicotinate-nucleotide pyrophosphorylase (carboxylating)
MTTAEGHAYRYHAVGESTAALIERAGLDLQLVVERAQVALEEDLAYGPDVTTAATVPAGQWVAATIGTRADGVVAGIPVALAVLDLVIGPDGWRLLAHQPDGTRVRPGDVVLALEAPTAPLLVAERTALNFLGHLSGVATVTRRWADALGDRTRVRDTRKTIPGLRVLDKYAVRCGGGVNHRMGLGDAALVKDNHVVAAGGVAEAVARVRAHAPGVPLEVECDSEEQVAAAVAAGVDLVLLDNMDIEQMRRCVELGRSSGRPVAFEASGGLTLEAAPSVAGTGVDFAAVGALTHSAPVLDLGLDVLSVVTPSLGSPND